MKNIKIVLVILFSAASIFAQTNKTGTTAAQVLKIGVGSRAIAMGGAYTANANEISSMYWNTAGLTGITSNEASFTHTEMYGDINHDYAGVAFNMGEFGVLGAFVNVMGMDEMPVRTTERPGGTGEYFDAGAMVVGLSYARALTSNFSIGFNAKYINENIYNMSATGFAIDIGTLYRIPVLNELRLASSISNFGTKMQLQGRDILVITPGGTGGSNLINSNLELDQFDLPLIFRFGIAVDAIKTESHKVIAALDAIHPNDHTEYINTGIEYGWNETIFLRGGWNGLFEKDSERGFTLGVGINYLVAGIVGVKVDYAYQDFGKLDNMQYFTIGVRF